MKSIRQISPARKEQVKRAIFLLRYRAEQSRAKGKIYMTYSAISRYLGLKYSIVQHLCRYKSAIKPATKLKQRVHRLTKAHVDFITDDRTLKQQAGCTLAERCVLFQLQFPVKRLAPSSLRRLYLRHEIKRKVVRQEKIMPLKNWEKFDDDRQLLVAQIRRAKEENRKIVFLDEVCFTKRSFNGKDWSSKSNNLSVDQKQIYQGYRAVIAAISEERGVELIHIHYTAVTSEQFINYLYWLKRKNTQKLAIFMDNLNVHRSKEVKAFYRDNDISCLYNVSYSPEFNPIESVFSQVKRFYNRVRLQMLVNDMAFDQTEQIKIAFRKIAVDKVRPCIKKSMSMLEDFK